MDQLVIRRARSTPDDARAVADVEAASLADSDLSVAEIRDVLAISDQYVYLARVESAGPVGLLATFETPSMSGVRLELDMLGVLAAWRCKGIAKALVERAMSDARGRGTHSFRAVVAGENEASRQVFLRCGLVVHRRGCNLLTYLLHGHAPVPHLPEGWSQSLCGPADAGARHLPLLEVNLPGHTVLLIRDAYGEPAAGLALLRVHTIAYTGYWIERLWARDARAATVAARAIIEEAKRCALHEVGMLVPAGLDWKEPLLEAGFERAGTYDLLVAEDGST